ncbi:MAG: AarF/ABC1/UbiB kinase family protein [Anaerolineae bacterium]|nr:AarF/ABC1/UbiB kinase family protein [Anaerolineae bacterium]
MSTIIQPATPQPSYHLSHIRYLRIVAFFLWLATQVILLYGIIQPVLGRDLVRRGEERRLRYWSQQFRSLAVALGGVMIKLGQFISSRIDILPPTVTSELADLLDEVPPLPFAAMEPTLRQELGPDWRSRFATLDENAVAAASLGQAYRGQLASGERVVVKIQRPGIADIVYTDLQALNVVARIGMRFSFIRRRANLPLLLEEFARVLWQELDYEHEAANAERFAALFRDDHGVYIPAIYREHTTSRVLTLEDVTAIKLSDYEAIEAAGIDRRIVAQRLLNTYLTMVFVHRFFHADPHPGNIFVYPLPTDGQEYPPGQRPFYLIFVDFGMTAELTPALVAGLRETLIALITRDSRRLVRSYQQLGIILPGADLERIATASDAVFDRVWGLPMAEIAHLDLAIVRDIGREFSDLLFSLPFQVPQDFIYLGRAVGILSGMCTGLDPDFDPWSAIQPFVRQLLAEDGSRAEKKGWADLLTLDTLRALLSPETVGLALAAGRDTLERLVGLPGRLESVLTQLERGELQVQIRPVEGDAVNRQRNALTGRPIGLGLAAGGFALSGALLIIAGETVLGLGGLAMSSLALLALLISNGRQT